MTRIQARRAVTPVLLAAVLACGDSAGSTGDATSVTSATLPPATNPTTGDDGPASTGDAASSGEVASTSMGTGTSTGEPASETTVTPAETTSAGESTSAAESTSVGSSSDSGDDTTTGVTGCECPDLEVPLDDGIFLLSSDEELWKFFPETEEFQLLGTLTCDGFLSPYAMAVDRQGYAWVQYMDGDLRRVPVTDVSQCEDPGYAPGQSGVNLFGMAFVSNSNVDVCDRIYGATYNGIGPFSEGPGFGDFISIDPDTLVLSKLGKNNFNGADATGTGDGRAFVFGGVNPAKLVEFDKDDGTILSTLPLGNLEIGGAFAFTFFAGDVYLHTDSDNDFSSEITRLDYDDSDMNGQKDLVKIVDAAPLRIVGSGVSTCAPVVPQ